MATFTPQQFSDWCRKEDARKPHTKDTFDPVEQESDLHDFILRWCQNQWPAWIPVHSRMDKRSTNQKGTPDFFLFGPFPTVIIIEAKSKTGKLRPEQIAWAMLAKLQGWTVHEVRSEEQFLQIVKQPNQIKT